MWRAAKNGQTEDIVKLHAAGAKVNFFDPEMLQSTPLHWAANNGHVDTIKKLVELGARSCLPMHLFSSCICVHMKILHFKR